MARTIEFKGSSNVRQATLGDDGVLVVKFANGGEYAYANVTAAMLTEWEESKASPGSWFHNRIRSKEAEFPVIPERTKEAKEAPASSAPAAPAAAPAPSIDPAFAELQSKLTAETARADKAEAALERLKASAPAEAKSTDFRPWRRG